MCVCVCVYTHTHTQLIANYDTPKLKTDKMMFHTLYVYYDYGWLSKV